MNVDAQPDVPGEEDAPRDALPAAAMSIDPFGFVPTHISRIGGLGGDMPGPIESYAFHTNYIPLDEGHVVFVVAFTDLIATSGTLDLIVNAMSPRPGAIAHTLEMQRMPLRLLAAEDGGRATIRFEALSGMTYSLFGQIDDETDARASALSIDLWRRSDLHADINQKLAGTRTEFTAEDVKPVARLISADQPTLANPVSQICTLRQTTEPGHGEWLALLGLPSRADPATWGQTYIMQALRRYGVLAPRARGLGLGVAGEPLPAAMAAMGCTVIATGTDEAGPDALRRPGLCDDAMFDAQVAFRTLAPGTLADDLADFDFAWSLGLDARIGSPEATAALVDEAMRCLKPGGVAVHVFGYDPDPAPAPAPAGPRPLRRNDLERMSLAMISRGHEIAQFKYDPGDALIVQGRTAFGIVVRCGMRV